MALAVAADHRGYPAATWVLGFLGGGLVLVGVGTWFWIDEKLSLARQAERDAQRDDGDGW